MISPTKAQQRQGLNPQSCWCEVLVLLLMQVPVIRQVLVNIQVSVIFSSGGFCQLIQFLEPCYGVPSQRYFTNVLLPALYNMVATRF